MSSRSATAALAAMSTLALAGCGGGGGDSPPARDVSPAAGAAGARASIRAPDGDWPQFGYDAERSGTGPARTGISAGNARTLRRRAVRLAGTADLAPIQLHAVRVRRRVRDVVILTTTYGRTIAIDPGTGAKLWQFVPSDIRSYEGSFRITNAGPVADPGRQYVYAASPDGFIHKLAVATGRQVWATGVTRDATHEKLASPLAISGNSVIATTGGYIGDAPPYQGHVVLIDRANGAVRHVWNSLCSDRHQLLVPHTCAASDSAIWSRAGPVLEPSTGRILIATGNAPFNGRTNWGDSVLELTPDASGLLQNFTPTEQAHLNATDADLGSTSPALLPDPGGPPLAVQGGKDGRLKLLNLNKLNGSGGAGRHLGGELQSLPVPGGGQMFTAPAVWVHGGQSYLFVADDSGTSAYVLHAGPKPRLSVAWQRGSPGTSPVLAGGLLFVYDELSGHLNVLHPLSGRGAASLPAGSGHWQSPIVVGGRVILGTGNGNAHKKSGELLIYHLRRR